MNKEFDQEFGHGAEGPSLPQSAQTLLPHRPPMLLAEALLKYEGGRSVASAILPTSGLFISLGQIIPEYFIELVAQTAALGNCYDALKSGLAPHKGMLVGIDSFSWPGQPQPGTAVLIETDKTFAFGAVKRIHGEVYAGKNLLAVGDIKVWEDLGEDARG